MQCYMHLTELRHLSSLTEFSLCTARLSNGTNPRLTRVEKVDQTCKGLDWYCPLSCMCKNTRLSQEYTKHHAVYLNLANTADFNSWFDKRNQLSNDQQSRLKPKQSSSTSNPVKTVICFNSTLSETHPSQWTWAPNQDCVAVPTYKPMHSMSLIAEVSHVWYIWLWTQLVHEALWENMRQGCLLRQMNKYQELANLFFKKSSETYTSRLPIHLSPTPWSSRSGSWLLISSLSLPGNTRDWVGCILRYHKGRSILTIVNPPMDRPDKYNRKGRRNIQQQWRSRYDIHLPER